MIVAAVAQRRRRRAPVVAAAGGAAVTDDFNRTTWGTASNGEAWTDGPGGAGLSLDGAQVVSLTSAGAVPYAKVVLCGASDGRVQVTATALDTGVCAVGRYDAATGNMVWADLDLAGVTLYQRVGGTTTALAVFGMAPAAPLSVTLVLAGGTASVEVGGVERVAATAIDVAAGTTHGLGLSSEYDTLDDFSFTPA